MDFNQTYERTVTQLVTKAIRIGDEIKEDHLRLRQLTDDALEILKRIGILRVHSPDGADLSKISEAPASASDGSFQLVGGANGVWFVPLSSSLVIFSKGIRFSPEIKINADIRTIDERKQPNVSYTAEMLMLSSETRILQSWSQESPEKIVHFLDGPIIDPPRPVDEEYVSTRASALLNCLDKKIRLLGCVKRLLGSPLLDHLSTILQEPEKGRMANFSSDANVVYHVFTRTSLALESVIYTTPIEIKASNPAYQPYKEAGLSIHSMYFQGSSRTSPFRVEIPAKADSVPDLEKLGLETAVALSAWSCPGYDLPLPIIIAHDKCNIRKGCAEVLYDEIITRSASSDMFDNLVRTKLGKEVF